MGIVMVSAAKGTIELNTVDAFAIEAVHQHHVRAVNIQRKTRADDQHVIAQPAGQPSREFITPWLVLRAAGVGAG